MWSVAVLAKGCLPDGPPPLVPCFPLTIPGGVACGTPRARSVLDFREIAQAISTSPSETGGVGGAQRER
eukprot:13591139-Heterocapsa_arctica.AAC.1